MKVLLVHLDRDFDPEAALPPHAAALTQDLGLDAMFDAMAGDDKFLREVARKVLLGSTAGDVDTIRYRQGVLIDCLRHPTFAQKLYDVAVGAIEAKRKHWYFGLSSRYPGSVLMTSVELMRLYVGSLRELRAITDTHARELSSDGMRRLCAMIAAELADDYLARVEAQLDELQFRHGVLITATLGPGNEIAGHVLRRPHGRPGWLERWFGKAPPGYTVHLAERDEIGARVLGALRDRGTNGVANALAQSVDHVESFFIQLRSELAFYLGCASLHAKLAALGAPTCIPQPAPRGSRERRTAGLYDPTLALAAARAPIRNELAADGASLVVITGANQGGKTTLLRALGVAQLMLHAGMFVAAEELTGEVTSGVFTHKREEDTAMQSGKLDEELRRLSELADAVAPDALVLLNESFASTNEREGSELARQVTRALVERGIVVGFVTHLYDFARTTYAHPPGPAVFLRAERRDDGTRTFKLVAAAPLATSFGADLYARVFGDSSPA